MKKIQIDSFEKLQFVPRAISNLVFLRQHTDYEFVMVSNQDGLGTESFPEDTFWPVHNFILDTLKGEGVEFDDILIDRHFPEDNAPTRKPNIGLVEKYINNPEYDIKGSYVIGDRDTDRQFAENIGCGFLQIGDWDKAAAIAYGGERTAEVKRTTKETDIFVKVDLDGVAMMENWRFGSSSVCDLKRCHQAVSRLELFCHKPKTFNTIDLMDG